MLQTIQSHLGTLHPASPPNGYTLSEYQTRKLTLAWVCVVHCHFITCRCATTTTI